MDLKRLVQLLALAAAFLFSACFGPTALKDNHKIQQYYARARWFFEKEDIDSSLHYVNKCLDIDRRYAPACHLLGEIYLYKDGIYNRRLSAAALRDAINYDENNSEYHYSLGQTLERQGFYMNALDEYSRAVALDSSDSRPFVRIAEINKRQGLRYDDPKYFRRALQASACAARLTKDPSLYYQQAVALYQIAFYDSSVRMLFKALDMCRDTSLISRCLLLLGAELVLKGQLDSASIAFKDARKNMNPLACDEMDDVRFLMQPSEYAKLKNESFYDRAHSIDVFWGQLDPDPTTAVNERKLEHYARFVHAQLTFSIPEKTIDGWKTKRGEMYIRYGRPSKATFKLGEGIQSPRWIWRYDQFREPAVFVFEDTFLNGDFDFPFPGKNWTADDFEKDPARIAAMTQDALPQTFEYSPGKGPLAYYFLPRQFKGLSGKTDIEVFVAIPHTELGFTRAGESAIATVDWRQVLRYQSWEMADSARALRSYKIRASQTDNPDLMVSDRLALTEYPDSLIFSIAITDTSSAHVGISTRELRLRNFYGGDVAISDIVLARRIDQPPGKLAYRRADLGIFTNLDNHYFTSEPIWLYFEVYNLKKGPDGLTSYTVRQAVTKKPAGGIMASIKGILARRNLEEIVTSYTGGSQNSDEKRVLLVDASQLRAGSYTLSLEVDDLISGKTARAAEDIILYK
jgi:GWxTD domain-containing protein